MERNLSIKLKILWVLALVLLGFAVVPTAHLIPQEARPSDKGALSILKQKCFRCHSEEV